MTTPTIALLVISICIILQIIGSILTKKKKNDDYLGLIFGPLFVELIAGIIFLITSFGDIQGTRIKNINDIENLIVLDDGFLYHNNKFPKLPLEAPLTEYRFYLEQKYNWWGNTEHQELKATKDGLYTLKDKKEKEVVKEQESLKPNQKINEK